MCSDIMYRNWINASRTGHSSLQVRRDQVVNDDGGKSVAKGRIALANARGLVAPHRTGNTRGS